MHAWLRRIHMYMGLLSWSILLVFGIAGVEATVRDALKAPQGSARVRVTDFTVAPDLTDKQVVEAVCQEIHDPFTRPNMTYDLHRDNANNLSFNFWTVSKGTVTVTVLEQERKLRIDEEGPDVWAYLNNLHTTTVENPLSDWRIRAWTYYTEFGIWMLIAMSVSGVWLWLSSRPGLRWAQIILLLTCASFTVLYVLTR